MRKKQNVWKFDFKHLPAVSVERRDFRHVRSCGRYLPYRNNISLFMADETALDGKAIRYTVHTNKGDYVYTKEGKTYRKGNRYVENIKMKGR